MVGRRPHRKSRLGCKRCKVRRMKCDETHPICINCSKHNLECDFDPSNDRPSPLGLPPVKLPPVKIPPLRKSPKSTPNSPQCKCPVHSTASSPSTSIVIRRTSESGLSQQQSRDKDDISRPHSGPSLPMRVDIPFDRLLEHRLMHHFVTMSSQTYFRLLGPNPGQIWDKLGQDTNIYVNWITRLALTNQHLMDALLGFSAFNLRNLDSTDRTLSQASHAYMTRAIAAHSEDLRKGIGDINGEVAFATSCLIAFTTISSEQYISSNQESELPLHWFKPWQGVRAIATAFWYHLGDSELKTLLEHERINQTPPKLDDDMLPVFDFLLQDLDRENTDPEAVSAYDLSVKWLTRMYHDPHSEFIFKFTNKVRPKFVKMLESRDPRTLTIVGYFFMLLRSYSVWWLPRLTKEQFWDLVGLLPDDYWKSKMEWAATEFERSEDLEPGDMPKSSIQLLPDDP